MSDAFWIALFASFAPTIAAIAALIVAIRTGRKVEEVRKNTNGLVEERVARAKEDGRKEAFQEVTLDRRVKDSDLGVLR